MTDLVVIKKSNKEEKFNSKKIINACKAAGASEKIAKQVASEITDKFSKLKSSKIRELALQKLDSLAPDVSNSWKKYDAEVKKS